MIMICFDFFLFCSSYLWIHYKHKCDVGFKGSTIILRGSEILCSRIWFVSIKIWVVSLHITARKQNRTDYRPIWFVFRNAWIAHELSKCWSQRVLLFFTLWNLGSYVGQWICLFGNEPSMSVSIYKNYIVLSFNWGTKGF